MKKNHRSKEERRARRQQQNRTQLTLSRFDRKSYDAYLAHFARFVPPFDAIGYEEYDQLANADLKQCEPFVTDDVEMVTHFYSETEAVDFAFQHATNSTDPLPGEATQVSADCPLLDALLAVTLALWDQQKECDEYSADIAVQQTMLGHFDVAQASIEAGDYAAVPASSPDDNILAMVQLGGALGITIMIQENVTIVSGMAEASEKHETQLWADYVRHRQVDAGIVCDEPRLTKHLLRSVRCVKRRAADTIKSCENDLSDYQESVDKMNLLTDKWRSGVRDPQEFEPYLVEFMEN